MNDDTIRINREMLREAYKKIRGDYISVVELEFVLFGPKKPREWTVEVHKFPAGELISTPGIVADQHRGRGVDFIRVREVLDEK